MKNPWQVKRNDTTHSKHVERRRIVAEQKVASFTRSPPEALLAKGNVPSGDVGRRVCVKQTESIYGQERVRWLNRIGVERGDQLSNGIGTVSYTHLDVYKRQRPE